MGGAGFLVPGPWLFVVSRLEMLLGVDTDRLEELLQRWGAGDAMLPVVGVAFVVHEGDDEDLAVLLSIDDGEREAFEMTAAKLTVDEVVALGVGADVRKSIMQVVGKPCGLMECALTQVCDGFFDFFVSLWM